MTMGSILGLLAPSTLEEHPSILQGLLARPPSPPQPTGLLGAAYSNPLLMQQFANQRAANPRPNVTDFMGYGPDWNSYLLNLNRNLQAQLPSMNDSPEMLAEKGLGLAGTFGVMGTTKKIKPSVDYRGQHTAPGPGRGSPLHEMTGDIYPDDIYGPKAAQFYGHYGQGDPMDAQTVKLFQGLRGKPSAEVTIYRAVPKDASDVINAGDWVTINPAYAKTHGDGPLQGDYKVISKKVKAEELWTDGNSFHEWGYSPKK